MRCPSDIVLRIEEALNEFEFKSRIGHSDAPFCYWCGEYIESGHLEGCQILLLRKKIQEVKL